MLAQASISNNFIEDNMSINLNLTLDEVNGVLQALGNLPFAQVEPLINKIREQAIPQAQEQSQKIQTEQSETPV